MLGGVQPSPAPPGEATGAGKERPHPHTLPGMLEMPSGMTELPQIPLPAASGQQSPWGSPGHTLRALHGAFPCSGGLRGCPGFRESSEPLSGRSWRLNPRSSGSSPAGPRAGVCSALGRSLPREPSGGSAARRERGTDTLRELRGELPSGLEPPGAGLAPGAPVSGARHPPNPPHIRGEAAISRAAFPISGAPARERCCGGRAGAGES